MTTLTTLPQVLGEKSTKNPDNNTYQHTRLYAWYSNVSGNSCTVHFRLTVVYEGLTYTGTNKLRQLAYDGYNSGTIAYSDAPLSANVEYTVMEGSRSYTGGNIVNTSALYWSYVFGSSDIGNCQADVPVFATAPSGLGISSPTATTDSVSAYVGVTNWGTGGSSAGHYLELSVCTGQSASRRKYKKVYPGDATSATITVDNDAPHSAGDAFTIQPNNRYYLTEYATNGTIGTGNSAFTVIYTKTPKPQDYVHQLSEQSDRTFTLIGALFIPADAGYQDKGIFYKIDSGSAVAIDTVRTGAETGVNYSIAGLEPETTYSIEFWSQTTYGGQSEHLTLSITTPEINKFYASVNGQTKRINKLYASRNGQTKQVIKLYGSYNGVTKRIY